MNGLPPINTPQQPLQMQAPTRPVMRNSDEIHARNMAAYHRQMEIYNANPRRKCLYGMGNLTSCVGLLACVIVGPVLNCVPVPTVVPNAVIGGGVGMSIAGIIATIQSDKPKTPKHPDAPPTPRDTGGG
ncbi:MAG TPA: hypothetical protein VFV43_01435 [Limnobacter sp.]|nr:hypothetical protein [Limnobacter sp.]